jgi:hypothetical protein
MAMVGGPNNEDGPGAVDTWKAQKPFGAVSKDVSILELSS